MPDQLPEPIVPVEHVANRIIFIRGHRVMLDSDLAKLYGVATKVLNQAVKRNAERFPPDFMIQLTATEADTLRSQFVTLKTGGRGTHRKYLPYAFTGHRAAMLSSVLKSKRAIQVNILVVRAFIRLRLIISSDARLARRLTDLEQKYAGHDRQLKEIIEVTRQLMVPPANGDEKEEPIGFHARG